MGLMIFSEAHSRHGESFVLLSLCSMGWGTGNGEKEERLHALSARLGRLYEERTERKKPACEAETSPIVQLYNCTWDNFCRKYAYYSNDILIIHIIHIL